MRRQSRHFAMNTNSADSISIDISVFISKNQLNRKNSPKFTFGLSKSTRLQFVYILCWSVTLTHRRLAAIKSNVGIADHCFQFCFIYFIDVFVLPGALHLNTYCRSSMAAVSEC